MRIIIAITLTLLTQDIFSQVVLGTYSVNQKYYGYKITLNNDSTFESSEIETGHVFMLYCAKGNWKVISDTLILNIVKLGAGEKEELTDDLMVTANYRDLFLIRKHKLRLIKRNGQIVKRRTLKRE